MLEALTKDLKERGGLDLSECFIDGTFVIAKRGRPVGKTKRGKSTNLLAVAEGSGLPLAVHTASASPYEVTLVGETLAAGFAPGKPERLIGDQTCDSDPLNAALSVEGIEMIAPHQRNRKRRKTQDGGGLRRYRRRWKIERLFAWLSNFRRPVVRLRATGGELPRLRAPGVHHTSTVILVRYL